MRQRQCTICERGCVLTEGKISGCGQYALRDGRVAERLPGRYLVACPISAETIPVLHFHPGAKFFQISTTGCNLDCEGCISTVIVREMSSDSQALRPMDPGQVVDAALKHACSGIAFLMNDPLASFPSFLKVARLAKSKGLKVGCSSNGYFTEESLGKLLPFLDFINVGMKGFSDSSYRACGAPGIQPVLRNLNTLHESGAHLEVSCIFTKDNAQELIELARFIAGLSPHIPLQVMRFLPFERADIAREPTIREAEAFCAGLQTMLDFVYLFNSPGTDLLHTRCPRCRQVAYHRDFYGPMGAKLFTNPESARPSERCVSCDNDLHVIGHRALLSYQEGDFKGGYPLTRALEMVQAMLITMGVTSKSVVVRVWEEVLAGDGLKRLHQAIQQPRSYIDLLHHFGKLAGVADKAYVLARYMEERLDGVESSLDGVNRRPRVYYAMGKPLFYLNSARLENQLVKAAGGISVNDELPNGGRPGRTLAVAELNRLNPEVIFISAFISNTVEDFHHDCIKLGIDVEAVRTRRIYTHPAPGWDFGSPRWILGLLFMASVLHPERCAFDAMAEADGFYRLFYGMQFQPSHVNRSFSKPSGRWRWSD